MPNYNFLDLSPIDFEELSRDLLQEHLGVTLESFKEGRDLGIDLRFSKNNKNSIIIQCKRYSSITNLKRNLKLELNKVLKLSPLRYIIVTSLDLTPKQKNDIKDIFKEIKLKLKDILGKKDINNLLGKFSEIEKKQYKLWLNSTSVLNRFLHSNIYNRSEFEIEIIKREIKIYVNNDSNKEAFQILDQYNYVIISGIPGIGKTTLARMLLYSFLVEGWEIIPISEDIKEADEVYQVGKAQIFYYDDFLGTNFLVELKSKNEDKRIVNFIERVKKSKDKKLILTTREYILNQAEQQFEVLNNKSIEIGKCTIDLKKYTKLIKGTILYNHIFYNNMGCTYISEILKDNRYLKIINHPNYNPRLIQFLTDQNFLQDVSCSDYFNYFMENLANPHQIWNYAFSSHICPHSRYLLIVFLSMGEPVLKEDLYLALSSFCEINSKYYGTILNEVEYEKSLKECESTFINIEKTPNDLTIIKFQNPSIKDFLLNYLNTNNEIVKHLINSSIFFNQFFDIYKKIVNIDEISKRLIISKVKKDLYILPVSTLILHYNPEYPDFIWMKCNYTNIEKLEKLSGFYDLKNNIHLLDFLVGELTKINLEDDIYGEDETNTYLTLIENISDQRAISGKAIIEKLYSGDKIENVKDIKAVKRLEKIFPDEYQEYMDNKIEEAEQMFYNAIQSDYSDLERYSSKYRIEEFIENISDLGPKFALFQTNALDLLSQLEEEETTKSINKIPEIVVPKINEEEALINIFNSLKN